MIIQYRDIPSISSLVFRGPGRLTIRQADAQSLRIEAPSHHLDEIESEVVDCQLRLGVKEKRIVDFSAYQDTIVYELAVNDLQSIQIKGVCDVQIQDTDRDELKLRLSGRAQVVADNLTADYLEVNATGRASLSISGDIEKQYVELSDEAEFIGEQLVCDSAQLRLTGDSQALLRVNDKLDAYVSERSRLTYVGYPDVTKLGAGKVERRRKQTTTRRGQEHG